MKTSEKTREYGKQTYQKFKAEAQARGELRKAVLNGSIKRMPCEICGKQPAEAHHDDYNKPLEVRWLCISCHKKWHSSHEPIRAKYKEREVYCPKCGKLFKPKERRTKYCSQECKYQSILENNRISARKNNYKHTKSYKRIMNNDPKMCKWCGKPFFPRSVEKYCSVDCSHQARLKQKRDQYYRKKLSR